MPAMRGPFIVDATVLARSYNKVPKTLYGTFNVHHLLERSLISESTK